MMNENKFIFRKDGIEIELSGDNDYLCKQIENWKPIIENLLLNQSNNLSDFKLNESLLSDNIININDLKPLDNTLENSFTSNIKNKEISNPQIYDDYDSSKNQISQIKIVKNISLDDFFELKKPESDIDKVIVAAYYFEKYDKYQSFSELDLYPVLNISDVENNLLKNLEKGYLAFLEVKNKVKFYTLTYSGEMYVREEVGQTH